MNSQLHNYTRETAPAVHEWTGPTGIKFRDIKTASGAYYHDTTPQRIVALLEGAMTTGQRIRMGK